MPDAALHEMPDFIGQLCGSCSLSRSLISKVADGAHYFKRRHPHGKLKPAQEGKGVIKLGGTGA
jgi:hypothetical protein